MDYESKKQARIDRYRELALNAKTESLQLHEQAHKMASVIPFGQPILVGHHSERSDRNFRNRIHNKFGKAIEASEKAEYYAEKAKSAENNRSISSDDPEAVVKLREKIEKAEKLQEIMKSANRIIKKKGMEQAEKVQKLVELGISESKAYTLFTPDFCGRIGFADYQLTNNNANIRRMKQRLGTLEASAQAEHKETAFDGFQVVENVEENRIQFIFDGKPESDIRQTLKSNGFRWSPSNMAWQRQLNNSGRYAAERIIKVIT